jgi:GNAT superfamily N-acetyltransferase
VVQRIWTVRPADGRDGDFIAHAALLATHDPGVTLPDPSAVAHVAHHARYFVGWPRPGDFGVIAQMDGRPVGAAWCRLFGADEREQPIMDPRAPELVIAVVPDSQSAGVGKDLVKQALSEAKALGHPAVELTVGVHRPWLVALYERCGFKAIAESGRHLVMRAEFSA